MATQIAQISTAERKPHGTRRRVETGQRVGTRQRVEAALRDGILQSRILPGTQLMQQNLAQELGASINLVREVLMSMVSQGLVASRPGIGFSVRELSVESFMEAAGVRAVLDGLAAQLCCRRVTRDDIEQLKQLIAEIRDICLQRDFDDRKPAHLKDRELHDKMFEISGSKTLIRAKETCWIPMISVDNPSEEYKLRYEDSYQEHLAIIAAIEEDRPDDAEHLARDHRRVGMQRIYEEAKRGSAHLSWY